MRTSTLCPRGLATFVYTIYEGESFMVCAFSSAVVLDCTVSEIFNVREPFESF